MRIVKLELENLNSLKGVWSVDFTHPAYKQNHDIFVICGPTGSGKTTLLDAITLALYGRTPRQKSVNNGEGGNELMTRGTGFCRAAVTYECKKGIFYSEFQQNRAKMSAQGKLQKATYQITDANKTVLFSGTASELEKATQQLTSLDYNQFCRSILLAQGEFSTFLKSSSRDRAAILEKLTGTEKYRKIAVKVAERFAEIKKQYLLVKSKKEESEQLVLKSADLKALSKKEKSLSKDLEQNSALLEQIQAELAYFEEEKTLAQRLQLAESDFEAALQAQKDFAPKEEILKLAESAKNCEPLFVALKNLRDLQALDTKELALLTAQLEKIQQTFEQTERRVQELQAKTETEEKNLEQNRILWKNVRELDIQLKNISANKAAYSKRLESLRDLTQESNKKRNSIEELCKKSQDAASELQDFLLQNEADSQIAEQIGALESLVKELFAQSQKANALATQNKTATEKCDSLQQKIESTQAELLQIEQNVKDFVSTEALFIVKELQKNLTDGKPCPVCGSTEHSAHTVAALQTEQNSEQKTQELAQKSSNFAEQLEQKKNTLQQLLLQQENAKSEAAHIQKDFADCQKKQDVILAELNSNSSAWNVNFTVQNAAEIISVLKTRALQWKSKSQEYENHTKMIEQNKIEIQHLTENIFALESDLKTQNEEYQKIADELQSIKTEREKLFGSQNVEEAEQAATQDFATLKKQFELAQANFVQQKEERATVTAKLTQTKTAIQTRTEQLATAELDFTQKRTEQGFLTEQEFLQAHILDAEFAALTEQSRSIKLRLTQAETSLQNAKAAHGQHTQKNHSAKTVQELVAQKTELLTQKEALTDSIVEVRSALKTNEQNAAAFKKIQAEFANLQESYGVWEQMSKWVGKSDGSDFSVFVQSLAFSSLLQLTNNYLFGITGRYSLVQKSSDSLDFEIKDIFFEETRAISNVSGGEQFIISLSLALGISEFAGRNVRVDSLFLDEGFGTLSGDLLTESINALRSLQKKGKMLGIITHVESVINEIDQKIEVRPTSSGHSILLGDGIHGEV